MESATSGPGSKAWERLSQLLHGEGPLDLVEAALWVAATEYSDLDVNREAARVRFIAGEGAHRAEGLDNPFERLDRIREFIYEDLRFRGNVENYKDPRNSFLNEVLNRRTGIPITLSIIFLEIARAAGFDARGVGLPGHFITRVTFNGRTLLVDPFNGGRILTEEDCEKLVTQTTGRPSLFRREYLEGTDERTMLSRLLLNLKHVYVGEEEYGRALSCVEWLLMVEPGDPEEIRDRGFLKANLGRPGSAMEDLEHYLIRSPEAPDAPSVRARVSWLRRQISEMN